MKTEVLKLRMASGEGEQGTIEIVCVSNYRQAKKILDVERCNGDRWAYYIDDFGDKIEDKNLRQYIIKIGLKNEQKSNTI